MNEEMHRSTNPDFQLDIMDLQTEIGKQTSTYAYYSDQLVEAKADRERLLNRLDLRESQIELEIREQAEASGQKLTETRIQSLIKVRDEIVDLKEKIVQANRAVGVLATAVEAMEHKKAMISNAVSMAVTNTCGLKVVQRDASTIENERNTETLLKRLNADQQSPEVM
jgi:hypothetical protein